MDDFTASQQHILNWLKQGDYLAARTGLESLLRLYPQDVGLLSNLVAVCVASGSVQEAQRWAQQAFLLAPADHTVQMHMAHLLLEQKRYLQASQYYLLATRSDPADQEAWDKYAHCLGKQGRVGACLDVLFEALKQLPGHPELHTRYLYYLTAHPGLQPQQRQPHFAAWNQAMSFATPNHPNTPDPERKLRIGYVSGDYRESVAAQVFGPLFEHRDQSNFELFAYHNSPRTDAVTRHFRQLADHWRDLCALDDDQAARMIYQDQIDLLVDLSGLMELNRLPVFARKPAPVQLTGLGGYLSSTGLQAIDGCVADATMIPPELEAWHAETIFHLRAGFHWQPRQEYLDLPLTEPPCLESGLLTLGCGNDTLKLNPGVIRLWARILQALPGAQLLLKSGGLEEPAMQRHFSQAFAQYQVDPRRIRFAGQTSPRQHLAFYQACDLALDPFPFNGAISTCDALWMGTPVISLYQGNSTIGAGILRAAGCENWIARNEGEYLAKVCQLASQPQLLRHWKQTLRAQLEASPICDGVGFCRESEALYRRLWQSWCQQQAGTGLS